ncbi:MAG: sugar ABC transporter substrate-binding protein [Verrucomicrobiales bacterium]|nr:sugar ABC transporter substrate-binding protein [Verrucomicrobiales bacterium]
MPNDGPYYDLKWQGVERKLSELGYQAQKYSAGAYKNVKAQTDIMDGLIQKKVAGIILHPVDGNALAPFVERAYENGIPVIAENVDIGTPHLAGSVQLANDQNGWELAMALASELQGKGKIVALIGPPGLDVTDTMWKSAKEYLARFKGIEIVREEYLPVNAPAALKVMESILAAHKDIDGVYAWYVDNAVGAIQAIKNAGYATGKIRVVCKDINPQGEALMREGYLNACLVGEPILMGEKSAELLDAVRKGLASERRFILRNRLVTLSTLDKIDRSKFESAK